MWGLLPFLLLDSDMKIPEEQILRVSPPLPLQFISYLFLTVKMSVLSSLTPISGTFGACLFGTAINLSWYKTFCEQALKFYCDIPLAVAVVMLTAFQSDQSFVA